MSDCFIKHLLAGKKNKQDAKDAVLNEKLIRKLGLLRIVSLLSYAASGFTAVLGIYLNMGWKENETDKEF